MPDYPADTPRRPADQLRRIVRYQRWVVAILLAQLALWVGYVVIGAVRGAPIADGLRFPTILSFILGGVGAIYTFLLYWTIHGPFLALSMGLAAVPPCIGTLVLLLANNAATTTLKEHGVRVGLLGAFESDISDDNPDDEVDEGW